MRKMLIFMALILFVGCHEEIQTRKIFDIPDNPWKFEVYNIQEETPCVVYKLKQAKYKVVFGDCLYMIFGHHSVDSSIGVDKKIFPNQKIKFSVIGYYGLMDIKDIWSEVHADTVFLVLRDMNEAYLVINGDEFEPDTVIWSTKISTGRGGKVTPRGLFEIKRKSRWARSITYDAPMYYGHQLFKNGEPTSYWIHEGYVTGKPASHGCIRVPRAWAQELWEITNVGLKVLIIDAKDLRGNTPLFYLKTLTIFFLDDKK